MQQTLQTEIQRIAKRAELDKEAVFIQLNRHTSVDLLREAHGRIRKDGAPGVSGQTGAEYGVKLEENIQNLYKRMREGKYRAPDIRRSWIPKEDGSKRPLGIPEFDDKIVQKAIGILLEAVYEQDIYDFSYGFRPAKSAHQALGRIRRECNEKSIRWIIDVDIRKFFDTIEHGKMMEVLSLRVNDGGLKHYVAGWLKAGILEGEKLVHPETGTPQGGVISPILANIYLHEVLDKWFVQVVQPIMEGRTFLVRYADDFVIGCECEQDARRILGTLPKRFEKYGLKLHETKTKLVSFQPNQAEPKDGNAEAENTTFAFLGFTHYWAKTHWNGWVIKWKTAAKRLGRTKQRLWQWCKENRHKPVAEQHKKLCHKLRGWYNYHALRCNFAALNACYHHAQKAWHYWLCRRSRKSWITWV